MVTDQSQAFCDWAFIHLTFRGHKSRIVDKLTSGGLWSHVCKTSKEGKVPESPLCLSGCRVFIGRNVSSLIQVRWSDSADCRFRRPYKEHNDQNCFPVWFSKHQHRGQTWVLYQAVNMLLKAIKLDILILVSTKTKSQVACRRTAVFAASAHTSFFSSAGCPLYAAHSTASPLNNGATAFVLGRLSTPFVCLRFVFKTYQCMLSPAADCPSLRLLPF